MSINCKATVFVTVQVDVTWCSTDKSIDEFFVRAARDASSSVRRALQPVIVLVGDPKVVLLAGESVDVPVPHEVQP